MAKTYTSKFTGQEIDNILTEAQESVSDIQNINKKLGERKKTIILSYSWGIDYLKWMATRGNVVDGDGNNISEAIRNGEYDNITIYNADFNSNEDKIIARPAPGSYYLILIPTGGYGVVETANRYVLLNSVLDGSIMEASCVILVLEKEVPDRWLAGYAEGFYALKAKTTLNIENGTGTNALQMKQDGDSGVFDFTGKNPNATELDETLTGNITYGATGDFATVVGGKASAQGKRSMAQGTTTIAKGKYSHSEGDNTVAYGNDSHAEGYATLSEGVASHAEGNNTIAKGELSHAEGFTTQAIGQGAHAEGAHTKAIGDYSHSGGLNTEAGYNGQTVVGHCNDNKETTVFEVGCGWTDENGNVQTRKNAFEVHLDGHAEVSFVPMDNNNAIPNIATLCFMGESFDQKIEEVESTIPTNISNGNKGGENGTNVNIQGGKDSMADYDGDFVFGTGLRNTMENQAVFGKYNDNSNWEPNRPLLMVGNGESDSNRKNAFEVYLDGHAEVLKTDDLYEKSVANVRYVVDHVSAALKADGGTKLYKHTVKLSASEGENISFLIVISLEVLPYDRNSFYTQILTYRNCINLVAGGAFGLSWFAPPGRIIDIYWEDGDICEVAISDNYYKDILYYDLGTFVSDTVEAL